MFFGFLVVRHPRSPRESTTFPAVFSQFPAGSYLSGISRFPDPGPRPGIRRGTRPSLPSVRFVYLNVLAVTLPFLVPQTTKHNAQDAGAWRGSSLSLTHTPSYILATHSSAPVSKINIIIPRFGESEGAFHNLQ